MPPDDRNLEVLLAAFKKNIPSGRKIAVMEVSKALSGRESDVNWIKENFGVLVERVQVAAYETYLAKEKKAGTEALAQLFLSKIKPGDSSARAAECAAECFTSLDRFFLSLTQSRRPRAGSTFEYLLKDLFTKLKYPFSAQPIINGQPDFVMPSIEYFKTNPPDCIIFTVKRTLRERWRQIVTEGTRGLGFFLATIDERVATRDLEEMLKARIHLVVPQRIKDKRDDYKLAPNVLTFEEFFESHLDPAMKRWYRRKIV